MALDEPDPTPRRNLVRTACAVIAAGAVTALLAGIPSTATAATLADRVEKIVQETGQTGFHFVDEAAPPKALKALAEELIGDDLQISWWGNIRFEKTFTPELSELLQMAREIAQAL
ncbi:MAG TPA: hypothetical protein PLZ93_20700, partial [Nocardioides sp.]|nr:hypothetical protein [Nocardioides sp.]